MPTTLEFICSEKATKFCKIFTLLFTTVHTVKNKVKVLQNFVAFSEYRNFTDCPPGFENITASLHAVHIF